jgi:hypothetical protein
MSSSALVFTLAFGRGIGVRVVGDLHGNLSEK